MCSTDVNIETAENRKLLSGLDRSTSLSIVVEINTNGIEGICPCGYTKSGADILSVETRTASSALMAPLREI